MDAGEPSGYWRPCPSTGDAYARVRGYHPRKLFETAKSCNLVHFGRKVVRNVVRFCVFKHSIERNVVPMRSGSLSTMRTAFPRVPLEVTSGYTSSCASVCLQDCSDERASKMFDPTHILNGPKLDPTYCYANVQFTEVCLLTEFCEARK